MRQVFYCFSWNLHTRLRLSTKVAALAGDVHYSSGGLPTRAWFRQTFSGGRCDQPIAGSRLELRFSQHYSLHVEA